MMTNDSDRDAPGEPSSISSTLLERVRRGGRSRGSGSSISTARWFIGGAGSLA